MGCVCVCVCLCVGGWKRLPKCTLGARASVTVKTVFRDRSSVLLHPSPPPSQVCLHTMAISPPSSSQQNLGLHDIVLKNSCAYVCVSRFPSFSQPLSLSLSPSLFRSFALYALSFPSTLVREGRPFCVCCRRRRVGEDASGMSLPRW